jgi:hypothetical protein
LEEKILKNWKRAVIKIGSSLIAPGGKSISAKHTLPIAKFITECRAGFIRRCCGRLINPAPNAKEKFQNYTGKTSTRGNWAAIINAELEQIF